MKTVTTPSGRSENQRLWGMPSPNTGGHHCIKIPVMVCGGVENDGGPGSNPSMIE